MVCKKCGYQNSQGASFCAGCGQKLTESNNTPQKKKMPNMVIAMLAGLACILLVALFSKTSQVTSKNALREAIAKHAVTFNSNMAVRNDGMAMLRYAVIEGWSNVASVGEVDAYYEIPIALRWDGTVLTGDNNPIVSQWRNIVAIYVTYDEIIGLCLDGTVVSSNPDSIYNTWTNVAAIHVPRTISSLLAITRDGTVLCADNNFDFSSWSDIVQINSGMVGVVGLRRNGTVLHSGGSDTQTMAGWNDVVSVDCYWDIMALRSDGTILTTAKEMYGTPLDFSGWNNIVAIDVNGYDYIGLKADGSVIATGGFEYVDEELDLSKWKDMVEVRSAGYSMIGLKADGTVLYYNGPKTEYLFYDVQLPD